MTTQEKIDATAPCGLDCFNCPTFERNITEEIKTSLADFFKKDRDKVACKGCRGVEGQCLFTGDCPTYACVKDKGVNYCYECNEFPCSKLAPVREGADRFPHNFKLFNLCRMKAVGVENWAENEALKTRATYYQGKFKPGHAPVLEVDNRV